MYTVYVSILYDICDQPIVMLGPFLGESTLLTYLIVVKTRQFVPANIIKNDGC